MWLGLIFGILVLLRLGFGPQFLMTLEGVPVHEINDGGRALSAHGAFLLGLALVCQLSTVIKNRCSPLSKSAALVVFFLCTLILSRQGTAGIAGLFGCLLIWLLETNERHMLRVCITVLAGALVAVCLTFYGFNASEGGIPFVTSDDLIRRQNNFETRMLIWDAILVAREHAGLTKNLIGWPYGIKPDLYLLSPKSGITPWHVSAHSQYYGTLISHGLIGTYAFFAIYLFGVLAFILRVINGKISGLHHISNSTRLVFILMIFILGVSYEIRNELGIILAICVCPILSDKKA